MSHESWGRVWFWCEKWGGPHSTATGQGASVKASHYTKSLEKGDGQNSFCTHMDSLSTHTHARAHTSTHAHIQTQKHTHTHKRTHSHTLLRVSFSYDGVMLSWFFSSLALSPSPSPFQLSEQCLISPVLWNLMLDMLFWVKTVIRSLYSEAVSVMWKKSSLSASPWKSSLPLCSAPM